jgi:hypothetical protein
MKGVVRLVAEYYSKGRRLLLLRERERERERERGRRLLGNPSRLQC